MLRSGHAAGADDAFEKGCDSVAGKKQIFLPWRGFNGSYSELYGIGPHAMKIARDFHPAWDRLSDAAKKLMGRNTYQILGRECEDANKIQNWSDFVVCFTPGGKDEGGTAQAIRIAGAYGIPIFNAGNYKDITLMIQEFNAFYKRVVEEKEQREIVEAERE